MDELTLSRLSLEEFEPTGSASSLEKKELLFQIARAQGFVCLVILLALVLLVGAAVSRFLPVPPIVIYIMAGLLSLLQVVAMYRLGKAVFRSQTLGTFVALLGLIPGLGLVVLLWLNSRATNQLQRFGYEVGLLGADLSQFAEHAGLPLEAK